MNPVGIAIFVVTWVLVSARRIAHLGLDRPAAALLGAVACVATGVLSADAALDAIDGATLMLLFGVMALGAFLLIDGFFDTAEARIEAREPTPAWLLGTVVWASGALSALVTNDAVCLLGAPLVVRLVVRHRLPPTPFLLALATGANTGSVATLVGNPQNMLCGELGGLSFSGYLATAAPVAVVGLAINHAVLAWMFRRTLAATPRLRTTRQTSAPWTRRQAVTLAVIAATAVAYAAGASMAWTAAGAVVVLLLLHRRSATDLWREIDASLLLFFAGLFVVVEGLRASGAVDALFAAVPLQTAAATSAPELSLAALFLVGSNLVSNVPFILVVRDQMATLADPEAAWTLLAMAATFAGNLTLLGSAANIIVAEAARDIGGLGFWEHLRVGLPVAVLTTTFAAVWMMGIAAMG